MKNMLKLIIPLFLFCLIVSGSLIYFYVIKEPTVVYSTGEYALDINNPREFVGYADYVFVGRVEEKIGTDMREDDPYTQYEVTVLNNLKGELITNKSIIISKYGGLVKAKNVLNLLEGDSLPEEGKTYMFLAIAHSDGSLTVTSKMSSIEMSKNDTETIKLYEDAVKNQIDNRLTERYKSIYDVNNK